MSDPPFALKGVGCLLEETAAEALVVEEGFEDIGWSGPILAHIIADCQGGVEGGVGEVGLVARGFPKRKG
jgi:hypothetical protein